MEDKKLKRVIDWDAMEPEWMSGIKTVQQLSKEYGVSRPGIEKHWAKENVSRDLSQKIRAKAKAIVAQEAVAKIVAQNRKATEKDIIESEGNIQAEAIRKETNEITRLTRIADGMEDELEAVPVGDDGNALDLEKRAKILKSLTEIREKVINLRRRNLNINDNANGDADKQKQDSISDLFSMMSGSVIGVSKAVDGD